MTRVPELDEVLSVERVIFLNCNTKREALEKMIDCLSSAPHIKNRDDLAKGIFHREDLMSTGIGMGIAVPHVRLTSVNKIAMCAAVCKTPITDYESLDGNPVRLIFMIAAGKDEHAEHLRLLAAISSKLKDDALREKLMNAKDASTFVKFVAEKG